jgi:hypothetical protein
MMTTEFLFFADLVLLLRLRWLLADAPVAWRAWLTKGLIEVVALGLYSPHAFLIGAGLTNIGINAAAGFWEARMRGPRSAARLLFGVAQLAGLSVWFSAAGGVVFRPALAAAGDWLAAWSALGGEATRWLTQRGLMLLFGLLLSANEANLVIRWMLDRLQLKPGNPAGRDAPLDANEYNRGRVIGLLERTLIYFFVLGGQYGAIGFTLAAKGFTRFRELENRGFAEYVLIGTLLSSGLALAIGAWVRLGN